MKRKVVWLMLPFVLFALMWSVKWRSEHPTPTTADLEFRALLSKPSALTFYHSTYGRTGRANHRPFALKNAEPFVNSLVLDPQSSKIRLEDVSDIISFHWSFAKSSKSGITGAATFIDLLEQRGSLRIYRSTGNKEYQLHPATVKHWTELLLASSNISPELRARMKS